MFRSLTSFIFGSNTSETTNRDQEQQQDNREQQQQQDEVKQQEGDAENTIEVTSSTPSVTGAVAANNQRKRNSGKRGKNRRNTSNNSSSSSNNSSNSKRKGQQQQKPPSITKLLTPNDEADEDLDDWFIVDKEDEDESLPRTDSEEELSIVDVKQSQPTPAPAVAAAIAAAQRRRQHFNSHSLYGGPRPQQQRNYLQRTRNNAGARSVGPLSVSTLSPPRSVAGSAAGGANPAPADGGVTQSLYVAAGSSGGPTAATAAMDESWFVTPPPCFTSIGPINMETSPFENLLIEHPSMSVYSSIRSAKEATESFVNLDLGVVEESQKRALTEKQLKLQKQQAAAAAKAVQRRATAVRLDSSAVAQMKQELLARTCQKNHDKHDRRQTLCRGAIARANKTRDFQSKSNRQRRSDQQHCKLVSGANNNRKTACY